MKSKINRLSVSWVAKIYMYMQNGNKRQFIIIWVFHVFHQIFCSIQLIKWTVLSFNGEYIHLFLLPSFVVVAIVFIHSKRFTSVSYAQLSTVQEMYLSFQKMQNIFFDFFFSCFLYLKHWAKNDEHSIEINQRTCLIYVKSKEDK